MKPEIDRLIKDAFSVDLRISDEAILNLGLLLEKYSSNPDSQSNYEILLPQELHLVTLDEDEQKRVLDELGDLVNSEHPEQVTIRILWAFGKATLPGVLPKALSLLLKFVKSNTNNSNDVIWQVLASIENFLIFEKDMNLNKQVLNTLVLDNPLQILKNFSKSENSDIREISQRIITKLGRDPFFTTTNQICRRD